MTSTPRYILILFLTITLTGCLRNPFELYELDSELPSYRPAPGTPILSRNLHTDQRPHPFPYSPAEIGLSAAEFTEFVRQRMWGCDQGCDFTIRKTITQPVKSQIVHGKPTGTLTATPLNIARVPKRWIPTIQQIADDMSRKTGLPIALSETSGTVVTFEDTRGRNYACLHKAAYIIIANQNGKDAIRHCLWQEIGHHFGLGADTNNFGDRTAFRETRSRGAFTPLDYASYWAVHDPRIPLTGWNNVEAISATLYHIAVHDLKLK